VEPPGVPVVAVAAARVAVVDVVVRVPAEAVAPRVARGPAVAVAPAATVARGDVTAVAVVPIVAARSRSASRAISSRT
jgi:hypothetical protein